MCELWSDGRNEKRSVQDAIQVEINVLLIRLESLKDHEVEVNW
jgi:hypothetical protein